MSASEQQLLRANAVCEYILANGVKLPNGQFSISIDSTKLAVLLDIWRTS